MADKKKLTRNNNHYNCGGFALSNFKWVTPYNFGLATPDDYTLEKRESYMIQLYDDYLKLGQPPDIEEIERIVTKRDVEYLLCKYPELELVNDYSEFSSNDIRISYRIFIEFDTNKDGKTEVSDTDFHFRVFTHGHWYEKCGALSASECEFEEDVWEIGLTVYDGPIIYFRKKN